MRRISLFLITTFVSISFFSIGQSETPKRKKVNELKARIFDYVPGDVTEYEVLFVDLDLQEVIKRTKKAHYLSYVKNGIDTLSGPTAFSEYEVKSFKRSEEKGESFRNLKDIRRLQKKLKLRVIGRNQQNSFDVNTHRYLLDIDFTSTKESPESVGFVITVNLFFVDRLTGKQYKKIDDGRISIADLVD